MNCPPTADLAGAEQIGLSHRSAVLTACLAESFQYRQRTVD